MLIENIDWDLQSLRELELQAKVRTKEHMILSQRGCRKYRKQLDEVWLPEMGISMDRHRVLVL